MKLDNSSMFALLLTAMSDSAAAEPEIFLSGYDASYTDPETDFGVIHTPDAEGNNATATITTRIYAIHELHFRPIHILITIPFALLLFFLCCILIYRNRRKSGSWLESGFRFPGSKSKGQRSKSGSRRRQPVPKIIVSSPRNSPQVSCGKLTATSATEASFSCSNCNQTTDPCEKVKVPGPVSVPISDGSGSKLLVPPDH